MRSISVPADLSDLQRAIIFVLSNQLAYCTHRQLARLLDTSEELIKVACIDLANRSILQIYNRDVVEPEPLSVPLEQMFPLKPTPLSEKPSDIQFHPSSTCASMFTNYGVYEVREDRLWEGPPRGRLISPNIVGLCSTEEPTRPHLSEQLQHAELLLAQKSYSSEMRRKLGIGNKIIQEWRGLPYLTKNNINIGGLIPTFAFCRKNKITFAVFFVLDFPANVDFPTKPLDVNQCRQRLHDRFTTARSLLYMSETPYEIW